MNSRVEHVFESDGQRIRVVEELRKRYPPKPLSRWRLPLSSADPDALIVRVDSEHAHMAERVLREGARGWRRWSTLRRRAGADFSPFVAETELLDHLVREAGLEVQDRFERQLWRPHCFRVDESVWPWLGIVDPAAMRQQLLEELTRPPLIAALKTGPPRGFAWPGFSFVLRAAERVLDLDEHGITPGERELAGLVDHTKAWTSRRRELLEELLGRPFHELVAQRERQIQIKGPVAHAEGGLWASAIDTVELSVVGEPAAVLLVENRETFDHLLPLADSGWVVLQIPGGPPAAEVELVARLAALIPNVSFYAAFDTDPAGIRIALTLEQRSGVQLDPTPMSSEILLRSERRLELSGWDRDALTQLSGRSGSFEPLRVAIERHGFKAEQEPHQRYLRELFTVRPDQQTVVATSRLGKR